MNRTPIFAPFPSQYSSQLNSALGSSRRAGRRLRCHTRAKADTLGTATPTVSIFPHIRSALSASASVFASTHQPTEQWMQKFPANEPAGQLHLTLSGYDEPHISGVSCCSGNGPRVYYLIRSSDGHQEISSLRGWWAIGYEELANAVWCLRGRRTKLAHEGSTPPCRSLLTPLIRLSFPSDSCDHRPCCLCPTVSRILPARGGPQDFVAGRRLSVPP